jgi:uncharacterized protein (DUF1499 family)
MNTESLKKCPSTPNCICTEYPDDSKHWLEPLQLSDPLNITLQRAKKVVLAMGGKLTEESSIGFKAVFTSFLFRFKDDFEIRIDSDNLKIHIRSASREGYSDLGVNARRVKKFKSKFLTES